MNITHLGFTGTRRGLSSEQRNTLAFFLALAMPELGACCLVHGGCVGADECAAVMAHEIGYTTIEYPSNIEAQRTAFKSTVSHAPMPPLDRNPLIVSNAQVLVACPRGFEEERRSGTWATVRYARRSCVPIVFIWPDGTVDREDDLSALDADFWHALD